MAYTRRIFSLMLLLLTVLTACSSPSRPPLTVIRVGSVGNDSIMQDLISAFRAENPSIGLETVSLSGNNDEITALVKDGSIDILTGFGAVHLAKADLLEPLDRFQKKDNYDSAPLGRIDDLQYNGHLYELPVMLSPFVLMYNREIVDQAGVKISDQPLTWDEFRDLARKLTSGEGNDKIWGFQAPAIGYSLEIYIRENTTDPEWWNDAQSVRNGYELFSEMIWNDRSCPPAPPLDETGSPMSAPDQGFSAGKAALTIQPLSSTRMLNASQPKVGATLLPLPAGHAPFGIARPFTLSMPAQSSHQSEAWRFMRFVAGPDGAAIIAKYGVIPGYRTPEAMQAWLGAQPAPPAGLVPLGTMPLKLLRAVDPTASNHENEIVRVSAYSALTGARSWEDAFADYLAKVHTAK